MNVYLRNKYFAELDDYNKDLLPHKQIFWQDCSTLHLKNFLEKLSFNLDETTDNFRFGKRYFSTQSQKFTWISSSDNKTIPKFYWDRNEHMRKSYDYKVRFTNDMIHDHFFSCFSTKRKIGFYYKSTDKSELDEYENAMFNMYKISGNTYGSSQKRNSNILLIDIDNYDDNHALSTLKLFLEYLNITVLDLLFLEQNAFTGGIHTALVLPHDINNEDFYPFLMEVMSNLGIRIECNFIHTILRFPLSYEYVAIKHTNDIFKYEEFIPTDLWEPTFKEFLLNLNTNVCPSNVLNDLILEFYGIKNDKESINVYKNYWKIKKNIIEIDNKKPKTFSRDNIIWHKIREGNRWDVMKKMIPYAKAWGFDLNDIIEIIRKNTESSKDLRRWSDCSLYHNISKFYSKCNLFFNASLNDTPSFISNVNNIPQETLSFLRSDETKQFFIKRFVMFYNKLREKEDSYNQLSKEKIEILSQLLPEYFTELFGLMFFSLTRKKTFTDGINEELGFQLPDIVIERLQNHYIEKLGIDSPIAKTSCQYLKKALLLTLGLEEIKYHRRKRNWMKGSCKSYRANSLNEINNILVHIYNSINSKDVINQFIDNINIIINGHNILFILPEGKQGFERIGQNMVEKTYDPPT